MFIPLKMVLIGIDPYPFLCLDWEYLCFKMGIPQNWWLINGLYMAYKKEVTIQVFHFNVAKTNVINYHEWDW